MGVEVFLALMLALYEFVAVAVAAAVFEADTGPSVLVVVVDVDHAMVFDYAVAVLVGVIADVPFVEARKVHCPPDEVAIRKV